MKKLIATYAHKISGLALFEDRRFEKTSGERYLFIDTNYLYLHFSKLLNKSKFILKPTSLTEEFGSEYIEIFELETHLTIDEYNFILFELIKNVNSFDQMNILIIPLLKHKHYTKELINYFIDKALNNVTIRRSFEVQRHLLSIIVENKELIEPRLFHSALSEFPHQSGEGWVDSGKL
jgi:hypothetical protein